MASSASLWSSQPFKAAYVSYFLLTTPFFLFLLSIQYNIKPLRPVPAWTVKENVFAALTKKLFMFWTATRAHLASFTAPQEAKEQHERVNPPPSDVFESVVRDSEMVKPAAVDAIWFPRPPALSNRKEELANQKVVLHFPGGAFVLAFSHKTSGTPITTLLNKHFHADRSIWAQYRLSRGTPETRFPGTVQDAITFYHHLLSLGFDASNIIVSGDSAGGNVAIALLRYLQSRSHSNTHSMPLPRGLAVFSPWVHVTSTAANDFDESPTSHSDVLHSSVLQWGADAYRPQGQLSTEIESYISPLHHPFELGVPLYIQAGTVEGFYGQIADFAEEMENVRGNRVRFRSVRLAPHNLPFCHASFNKTKELEDCLDEACEFFEEGMPI